MVRCTWGRTADQAAEQTAHPTSGPRRRPGLTSDRCTQTDEEPLIYAINPAFWAGLRVKPTDWAFRR